MEDGPMGRFLIIAATIFIFAGLMIILAPKWFEKISKTANKPIFDIDDKARRLRKPIAIIFLLLAAFLLYVGMKNM